MYHSRFFMCLKRTKSAAFHNAAQSNTMKKLLTLKTMKDTKTSNRLQRYYIF